MPKDIREVKVKTLLNAFQKEIEGGDEEIDGHKVLELEELFEEVHPANAGKIVRAIANGLDNGFSAQGSYHPDFQSEIHRIVKDPDERFDSPEELTETHNVVLDKRTYEKYKELENEYGSLENMLEELDQ